ncbi:MULTISPECIES: MFS transporter [Arthrobacter]|uniref:MFS transporter n=1 Tax=Arthrobacter TaxID=1663 RepID=UPI001D148CDD|nr:MFS transporter [Arthrobacter caoxuetaonis]MCC9192504.1 MFS transporter [Arthrobacter sp. zg-Y916]
MEVAEAIENFSLRGIAVPAFGPTVLYGTAIGAILPVIALTARDLGATVALAALIITLTGVGSLLTNVPATLITTRFGEKWALVAAAGWCALAMVLAATVPVLWVFALAVFMVGMAGAVFGLARQTYVTEAVPLHFRARALSTLGGSNRIGVFMGPFAAAAAMHFAGTPGAYWVGAAAALGAGLLSLTVPELTVRPRRPGQRSREEPGEEAAASPAIGQILSGHSRTFRTVGIGVLLIAAVRATRQAVIPLWALHLGIDPAQTAIIYGISAGIDMLIFYPAGRVMDLRGRRAVAVPCMLFMAAGLALLPLTSSPLELLLAALLIGFGNGIGSGIVMTLGADFSPSPGRPQFLGLWRLLSDIGILSGPGILSGVTALFSLAAGIGATAVLGLAGAAVLWRYVPKGRPSAAAGGTASGRPPAG